jgi:hypothetical protein
MYTKDLTLKWMRLLQLLRETLDIYSTTGYIAHVASVVEGQAL